MAFAWRWYLVLKGPKMRVKGVENARLGPFRALSWSTSCSRRTAVRPRGPSACGCPHCWTVTSCWWIPEWHAQPATDACRRCCVQRKELSLESIRTAAPCTGSSNRRCISSKNSLNCSLAFLETQAPFGLSMTKILRGSLHHVEDQRRHDGSSERAHRGRCSH